MRRTTLTSARPSEEEGSRPEGRPGSLKVFFSYAPCSGASSVMLDEASGFMANGLDVFVADAAPAPDGASAKTFDLDQVLKRRPDVAVLENLAFPNPEGSRNHTRYQDAEELLRAGIDVYATLRVSDLQNERERVRSLGVEVPANPVPDYMLYRAHQVEFVDIDPSELVSRARSSGRGDVPVRALNELRALALRCVSAYVAASGSAEGDAEGRKRDARGRVVAVVEPGVLPGGVLIEAVTLANVVCADVDVVCVRREMRPADARFAGVEARYAALREQVEAMGFSLTVLYGEDAAEIVNAFVRSQGASDVVVAHRRPTLARRVSHPFAAPFEERLVDGLASVNVHLVAGARSGSLRQPAFGFKPGRSALRAVVAAVAVCAAAYGLARLLSSLGFSDAAPFVVFFFAAVAAAECARSYVPAFLGVALCTLALDYFFLRPYLSLAVDHRASLSTLVAFAALSAVSAFFVVRARRAAYHATLRERRTQALFDLGQNLSYARGTTGVCDTAVDCLSGLLDRSVAAYLYDPLAPQGQAGAPERRLPTVRSVPGDLERPAFEKLPEQAIVHWVFANGKEAGRGTETHDESDVHYLPLSSPDGFEGVLAVSSRRPLDQADLSFVKLAANQVTYSLERQSLAAKHRGDLELMHVTGVRAAFSDSLVAAAGVGGDTIHAIAERLYAASEEDRAYRDALLRALNEETSREHIMVDRMMSVLETPVSTPCAVRAEVSRAVEEVREGLSGKVIDLQPGDPVAPVAADPALVRAAVKLVLEAMCGYIDKRGIVRVSVESHPDRVIVTMADDRPSEMGASHAAAFEVSSQAGREGELVYARSRSTALCDVLADRDLMTGDQQAFLAALCRAEKLPLGVARPEGAREGALNRQRILRFDRLEYGLYMAALVVRAHGGTIKQRHRLGGGAVVTVSLPHA